MGLVTPVARVAVSYLNMASIAISRVEIAWRNDFGFARTAWTCTRKNRLREVHVALGAPFPTQTQSTCAVVHFQSETGARVSGCRPLHGVQPVWRTAEGGRHASLPSSYEAISSKCDAHPIRRVGLEQRETEFGDLASIYVLAVSHFQHPHLARSLRSLARWGCIHEWHLSMFLLEQGGHTWSSCT